MSLKDRIGGLFGGDDEVGAGRQRLSADRKRIRAGRGRYQSMLDREATPADLDQLREFIRTRRGVELYVEPETSATDTTAVAVASDGEWIRRRVGSPSVARNLATRLGVPVYDAAIVGYPLAMRRYRRPDSGTT
ncbi:MAG: hypothetical protein JWP83_1553 [Mycobacterium sp.]|uniref:oxidoreductase n=1 Tax=Mycobacterium sp. TaxID=1785 RepID=UPI002620FB44|nr:oxidoreductase [Mycobacterium sp.]MCW2660401.1 hypothetical protein [Mycobacterium sp.]